MRKLHSPIAYPKRLSEALPEIDWGDHDYGAQRVVLYSKSGDWVLKAGYAQANENELAWSRRSTDVAETRRVKQDIPMDETWDGLTFVVQEAVIPYDHFGGVYERDEAIIEEGFGAVPWDLFDMCGCDLHEGNVGFSERAGQWVVLDAGCCHPTTRENGGFDGNSHLAQEMAMDLEAYASVLGE